MNVPFLDLKAQYRTIKGEIDKKISDVVESQQFVLGREVEALEKELADYSGTRFGVGVSSGTDALIITLMALGVERDDAVLTTPFTFFSTAGAIVRLGATPVFCDIQRNSFNIDPYKIEGVLVKQRKVRQDSKIKVLLPVHLFGQCAEMSPILELAERYELCVVEDAAQSVGAEYAFPDGIKKAGAMGDAGILSFYPSKNLGAYGDGGMVLANNRKLAHRMKLLRVHGSEDRYFHKVVGGNFRLDAIQAAVLRVKLKYLDEWQQKRREKAAHYDKLFAESSLLNRSALHLPEASYSKTVLKHHHTFYQYVIRAQQRDELKAFLSDKGIGTAVYYPLPLHLQKCFVSLGYRSGDFPESELAASEVLALPIYPELTREQQEYVVTCIQEFYDQK
jgi:dTDP-4-amino-4,6-dideoxygalactose transaminase